MPDDHDIEAKKPFPADDRFVRLTFHDRKRAAGLLREYLPPDLLECLDLTALKRIDSQLVDGDLHERRDDLNLECPLKTGGRVRVRILVEHKSAYDSALWFQLTETILSSWKDSGFAPVIPVVIHTGPDAFRFDSPQSRLRGLPSPVSRMLLRLRIVPIDLASIPEEKFWTSHNLDTISKVALAILKLAQKKDLDTVRIRQVLGTRLVGLSTSRRRRLTRIAISYLQYKSHFTEDQLSALRSDMALVHPVNPDSVFAKELREAKAQGIALGLQEGLERKSLEDVERMLENGFSWQVIQDITHLDQAGFEALKTKYGKKVEN